MNRKSLICLCLLIISVGSAAQQKGSTENIMPGQFDQGKMWTFEEPPYDYFNKTYGVSITQDWMDEARLASLRFASWCSASFVSESGLILTNQHCSRGVVGSVMNENENFDANGFYALNEEDERKIPDLYVDQLVKIADITDKVNSISKANPDSALAVIRNQYQENDDWKGLRLETRTFYSGKKYSLYGYKRYNDIRLVLYPELQIGFFGGDPDNFTYPRYDVDFTLFRAYDENGNPMKPAHYFKFNEDGPAVDDAVFVIGNPGGSGRYLTMAQLYNMRDMIIPLSLTYYRDRMNILRDVAGTNTGQYDTDSLNNLIFDLSNSEKNYTGILKGLNDPEIMAKKENKEKMVRSKVKMTGPDPWDAIGEKIKEVQKIRPELSLLRVFPPDFAVQGKILSLLPLLADYQEFIAKDDTAGLRQIREEINMTLIRFDRPLETELFATLLKELKEYSKQNYVNDLLDGKSPEQTASEITDKSILINDTDKFFSLKENKLKKEPLLEYANVLMPEYRNAVGIYRRNVNDIQELNKEIINLQYDINAITGPPDATFSLRISDGVVKGYEYNGTVAPPFTTFYGLFDRYYSHGRTGPWDLPEKWLNPPAELLKTPLDFVCTADVIGGNSGSPVINSKRELVGLVFDGNIESLPGYFIFDDTYNRTVAVDAAGIYAALKYIYKADRILEELK